MTLIQIIQLLGAGQIVTVLALLLVIINGNRLSKRLRRLTDRQYGAALELRAVTIQLNRCIAAIEEIVMVSYREKLGRR